ncbi:PREDICTED: GDSL esterase/lipase At5g08460-like isoform X2 [Ipomoea nil]|uniref:GDSL esterase/lipase At5g08460-like isoform X2 n=1 Tax=Ipomoea nil TaxID=35883 RepID=UPI0009009C7D|nr:PREDICTED: GDSL esterase/lipase At5g08460-like isoform X2 [Ipomoea nil]
MAFVATLLIILPLGCAQGFINSAPSPSPNSPPSSPPLVPALFVIGDSSVDCGNHTFLGNFARADRLPYGRDFDTRQPTGRFSNGRIAVDYLGLPFVPGYHGKPDSADDLIQGVNYASAEASIVLSTGSEWGGFSSLTHQIQHAIETFQQIKLSMGEEEGARLISNSIFYISIGTNDYIRYYHHNRSDPQSLYLPWSFNQLLIQGLKQEIVNLYDADVRKVVVMGLGPMGCAPYYIWRYRNQPGHCVEIMNDMIVEFNLALRYIVDELGQELADAKIIFCDAFQSSMEIIENLHRYGFSVNEEACCGFGRRRAWFSCMSPEMACSNASNHIWWDQFHPTDAVNAILADNIWSGLHSSICYPMNLLDMI